MKGTLYAALITLAATTGTVQASGPLVLTKTPESPIITEGQSIVLEYTLYNGLSHGSLPISIKTSNNDFIRNHTVDNDCGSAISAGTTCHFAFNLEAKFAEDKAPTDYQSNITVDYKNPRDIVRHKLVVPVKALNNVLDIISKPDAPTELQEFETRVETLRLHNKLDNHSIPLHISSDNDKIKPITATEDACTSTLAASASCNASFEISAPESESGEAYAIHAGITIDNLRPRFQINTALDANVSPVRELFTLERLSPQEPVSIKEFSSAKFTYRLHNQLTEKTADVVITTTNPLFTPVDAGPTQCGNSLEAGQSCEFSYSVTAPESDDGEAYQLSTLFQVGNGQNPRFDIQDEQSVTVVPLTAEHVHFSKADNGNHSLEKGDALSLHYQLLNDGESSTTIKSITAPKGLTITDNTCSELAFNSSCGFTVNLASAANSIQGNIEVKTTTDKSVTKSIDLDVVDHFIHITDSPHYPFNFSTDNDYVFPYRIQNISKYESVDIKSVAVPSYLKLKAADCLESALKPGAVCDFKLVLPAAAEAKGYTGDIKVNYGKKVNSISGSINFTKLHLPITAALHQDKNKMYLNDVSNIDVTVKNVSSFPITGIHHELNNLDAAIVRFTNNCPESLGSGDSCSLTAQVSNSQEKIVSGTVKICNDQTENCAENPVNYQIKNTYIGLTGQEVMNNVPGCQTTNIDWVVRNDFDHPVHAGLTEYTDFRNFFTVINTGTNICKFIDPHKSDDPRISLPANSSCTLRLAFNPGICMNFYGQKSQLKAKPNVLHLKFNVKDLDRNVDFSKQVQLKMKY